MNVYFLQLDEVKELKKILDKACIKARFVGGCVRDSLLGKKSEDFDIAFKGTTSQLISSLCDNKIKYIDTAKKYGTITVIIGTKKFELTTLRKDVKCYGRDCDVVVTPSLLEDATRRDFTINSIYLSFDGKILDPFGGINDLHTKTINFIGEPEKRIKEDVLRILRYYRFLATIESRNHKYHDVMKKTAPLIKQLSKERIQQELFKIIANRNSSYTLNFMIQDDVLAEITRIYNLKSLQALESLNRQSELSEKLFCLFDFDLLIKDFKLTKQTVKKLNLYRDNINKREEDILNKLGGDFWEEISAIRFALDTKNSLKL
jgi:poly(A) polymerase